MLKKSKIIHSQVGAGIIPQLGAGSQLVSQDVTTPGSPHSAYRCPVQIRPSKAKVVTDRQIRFKAKASDKAKLYRLEPGEENCTRKFNIRLHFTCAGPRIPNLPHNRQGYICFRASIAKKNYRRGQITLKTFRDHLGVSNLVFSSYDD